MSGIFCIMDSIGILNNDFIYKQFQKANNRSPNNSQKLELGFGIKLGFHDLYNNTNTNIYTNNNNNILQPIIINNVALVCNGNILNYKELFTELNIKKITEHDCEIIIHLYNLYGIETTLQLLDGEFSFVLYDMKIIDTESNKIFISRDPLGIKPLYVLRFENHDNDKNEYIYAFASELKILSCIYNFLNDENFTDLNKNKNNFSLTLKHFNPGTYSLFEKQYTILSPWKETIINKSFFSSLPNNFYVNNLNDQFSWIIKGIQKNLYDAVKKRYLSYLNKHNNSNSNNNFSNAIGCLLSGGLDSSIITSLVWQIHKEENKLKKQFNPIETFSIGLENSEDLKYAKKLSEYLETKHHEIIITQTEIMNAIPEVIKIVETYDLHTIRCGIINYLLSKYIKENSKVTIVFGGDGADELFGGYTYLNNELKRISFDVECRRLITDLHIFDLMCTEKCFAASGLEISFPFLDKNFVNFYFSIPMNVRFDKTIEKKLIRNSFSELNYIYHLLPNEILWRKKNNLNRGFWTKYTSLSKIIQENLNITRDRDRDRDVEICSDNIVNYEKKYYKDLFNEYFSNIDYDYVVPYFWKPKYTSFIDTNMYNNNNNEFHDYISDSDSDSEYESDSKSEYDNDKNYIVL